jgi:hypothetical protein
MTAGKITAKWGNPYQREVTVTKDDEALDLTDYTIRFTVKDSLNRDDDEKALIQVELVIDPDQVENKGKATLLISADENKIAPNVYYADFKVFDDADVPVNTQMVEYELKQVVGKDE